MGKIILSIILFLFIFCTNTKKKKSIFVPSNIILGLYLFVLICAIPFAYVENDMAIMSEQYVFPALVFILYLLLFLLPFSIIPETSVKELVIPNKKVIKWFSLIIIALSLYAIYFFISGVVNVFAYGDLSAARNVRYEQDVTFVGGGISYTIASVASSLYPFAIMLFFLCTITREKLWIRLLLLIGSFSETLHILTEVGRDGAVFWLFSFVFLFLFFKPFIDKSQIQRLKKVFVILAVGVSIPFVLISMSRFGDMAGGGFLTYFGQQFSQACYTIDLDPLPVRPGGSFPLYYEITHQPMPKAVSIDTSLVDSTAFGTFVRTFLTNFGYLGTIVVAIIMALFVLNMVKIKNGKLSFYSLFIYILYFQVYSQGVFYFRQYHRGGNLFIVLCFVFYFVFKLIQKSSSSRKIIIN